MAQVRNPMKGYFLLEHFPKFPDNVSKVLHSLNLSYKIRTWKFCVTDHIHNTCIFGYASHFVKCFGNRQTFFCKTMVNIAVCRSYCIS